LPPDPDPPREPGARGRNALPAIAIGAGVAALLALAISLVAVFWARHNDSGSKVATTKPPSSASSGGALDVPALLRKASPSVVSIETAQQTQSGGVEAAGSGLIISADGLVLTNAHVVAGAQTMKITLSDGHTAAADLVGSLPDADIAIVRIRGARGLTPADLGSSDDAQVGDPVVAIGNALDLGGPPSVTEGIISAKDRSVQTPAGATMTDLIQTDAAINPGNSGGPLLDASGRVIGLNTAIINNAQNIGFAIAIDAIKPLITQIEQGEGTVTQNSASLGVNTVDVSSLTSDQLQQYGVTTSDGAFVQDVATGSAAAAAQIQIGDVITAVDATPVNTAADLQAVIQSHKAGDQVTITLERQAQITPCA
jgi:S1-C subfamily serine protease